MNPGAHVTANYRQLFYSLCAGTAQAGAAGSIIDAGAHLYNHRVMARIFGGTGTVIYLILRWLNEGYKSYVKPSKSIPIQYIRS